jgi:hypothetical protein
MCFCFFQVWTLIATKRQTRRTLDWVMQATLKRRGTGAKFGRWSRHHLVLCWPRRKHHNPVIGRCVTLCQGDLGHRTRSVETRWEVRATGLCCVRQHPFSGKWAWSYAVICSLNVTLSKTQSEISHLQVRQTYGIMRRQYNTTLRITKLRISFWPKSGATTLQQSSHAASHHFVQWALLFEQITQ